jgi:hypothetical protein
MGWLKNTIATGLLLAATYMVAACGPIDSKETKGCTSNSECRTELGVICDDELCKYEDSGKLFCESDLECGWDETCENQTCENENEKTLEKIIGGVRVSEAITDKNGIATFQDPGETVKIMIESEYGQVWNNSTVLYFDGQEKFKCFMVSSLDSNAFSLPVCFDHNSEHNIAIISWQIDFNAHKDVHPDASDDAMHNFHDWTKSNWKSYGCRDKEELVDLMKGGQIIANNLGYLFSLGAANSATTQLNNILQEFIPEDAEGEIYGFIPIEHGFRATTSIWTVYFNGGECGDQCSNVFSYIGCIDDERWSFDECDKPMKKLQECNLGCIDGVCLEEECEPVTSWKVCQEDDIYTEDNCGNLTYEFTCSGNTHCDDGKCVTEMCQDECENEGSQTCLADTIISCEENSQGCLETEVVEYCDANEYCANGQCFELEDYNDQGNGTVLDSTTGNIWQKGVTSGSRSYEEAVEYCENLSLAEINNWRLPTEDELVGIRDTTQPYDYLPEAFSGPSNDDYQSSTATVCWNGGSGHVVVNFVVPYTNNSSLCDIPYDRLIRCIKK